MAEIKKDTGRDREDIKMSNQKDEVLTLKEAASFLKISPNYVYKIWPSWRDAGVKVLKLNPNSTPRFYKSDILRMLETQK